ncbi:MAG TPA: branched-chain amino acid ABC transporter permease [Gaiellaceae bacterium]|nr:branched-chain amino acid ABC transporter permease [Gaiellaceae bacterium]
MAETGRVVDEYRDPWYHRWAGLPGEWRRRWRGMDERQRFMAGIVIRAAVVVLLVFAIDWPIGLLAAVLFAVPYGLARVPRPWSRFNRYVIPTIILVVAVTYPFYLGDLGSMNVLGAYPDLGTAVIMGVYAMMAIGLNIVVGYAGLLDLGYVAFYAMGAYTCAWFASVQFAHRNIHFGAVGVGPGTPGIHISIWILLVLAGILTAIIGIIIGLPTLRLRGDYLAIVTLGFGEILPQIARNGDSLGGFNLTNGPNGITPIDPPGFGSLNYLSGSGTFFTPERLFFWSVLVLVIITIFCSLRLRDSRLGRAWIAIREDETAAAAMGVPLMRTKTWAYATGAFFGGLAGAYFASFKQSTFPGDFSFNISAFILSMVILGGMGNVWGVVFGAAFLAFLNQQGLSDIGHWFNNTFGTNLDVPKYQYGIYGLIIVATMLLRPEGLIPSARRKAEFREGVHDTPLYDTTQ